MDFSLLDMEKPPASLGSEDITDLIVVKTPTCGLSHLAAIQELVKRSLSATGSVLILGNSQRLGTEYRSIKDLPFDNILLAKRSKAVSIEKDHLIYIRVVVSRKGSFANRVQCPVEAIYPLPEWMLYEEASTIPAVYFVSLYGLIDLANTRQGQTVLIHSAAGSVGITIYATVGTDEKRKFLIETFGIKDDHIFSSREFLDESWRCIADHGTFVEIGKEDMTDRNNLSRDKMFAFMTNTELDEAIHPKLKGTWNLHKAALEYGLTLDFFTMLSSICGVVGQTGQANYSAANTFLDAFSIYLNQLGLCASSTDLGVVGDVGYVSTNEVVTKRLNSQHWLGINESLLYKILDFSLHQESLSPVNNVSKTQLITGIPMPLHSESSLYQEGILNDPRFSHLSFGDP
ncbi:Fumagillin dodecapentaenoate synthase [Lachnellula occidentalis]|uniref:Fumagillin dodecapentaenoate synthase n=1 Tax=Lachnellula occidentalis TaxID=215460 RepID=A0A8H8RXE2_9HELO|nr:Fumagillin dodecapentaenoate synthase [Lachnellula occidentalis]